MPYFLSFTIGFLIMGLEIIGLRLVQFNIAANSTVIGIVLGVIICALALGNLFGGFLCSQKNFYKLYHYQLIFCSLYIFITHLFIIPIYFDSFFFRSLSSQFSQTISVSVFFYFLPCFIFGQNLPVYLKYNSIRKVDISENSSRILACSSFGSILGTVFTSQFLLLILGQRNTIVLLSVALLILGSIVLLNDKRKYLAAFVIIAFFPFISIYSNSFEKEKDLFFSRETKYGTMKVFKGENWMMFKTSNATDSFIDFTNILNNQWTLSQLMAPVLFKYKDALILGLSAGVQALQLNLLDPDLKIDGVEIDEDITRTSNTLMNNKLLKIVNPFYNDARFFLKNSRKIYDFILLDVFKGTHIPEHCVTEEFFRLIYEDLSVTGSLAINTNLKDVFFPIAKSDEKKLLIRRLEETLYRAGFVTIFYNAYTHHLYVFKSENIANQFLMNLKNQTLNINLPIEVRSALIMNYLKLIKVDRTVLLSESFTDDKTFDLYLNNQFKYIVDINSPNNNNFQEVSLNFLRSKKIDSNSYENYFNSATSFEGLSDLAKYLVLDKRNLHFPVDLNKSSLAKLYSNIFYHFRRKEFNQMIDTYQLFNNNPYIF